MTQPMKSFLHFIILFCLALFGSIAAGAEPLPTVAVYDFNGANKPSDAYSFPVAALVTADLAGQTNLAVLERADLDQALSEQAFGASGLVDSEAAAKIGQLTGAKILVSGEIIKTDSSGHLVIIANIIGTETGRLFVAKVEGGNDKLVDLVSDLSQKISQTISGQLANLVAPTEESHEERIARIVQSVTGTNRPVVLVRINWPNRPNRNAGPSTVHGEFGILLLKAGFKIVDGRSDLKPDVEITGTEDLSPAASQRGFFTFRAVIDLSVRRRLTGEILAYGHGEGTATDVTSSGADRAAQMNATDEVAATILPLLAK
jgi:Curli production assembly/transport component CsgG